VTAILSIHLLGDFSLTIDDVPVATMNVHRLQSLLAYLLLHRDAPQDRSRLAFLLWPDSSEAQAHTNLRKLLHQLRQSFPNVDAFLCADKHMLQWLPEHAAWTLDLQQMEEALAQAEQAERDGDTIVLRRALEQVMSLYRGDLLPSCYDEWILPERDRWRQRFLSAAERLIALQEQERDYAAAIAVAQQLLRMDSLHEATYRQLMRLYALRGDRAAALRVYHTLVTVLERELATEPGAATRAVYESLLQSDAAPRSPTGPLTTRSTAPPLLGRKAEWRQLQGTWRMAAEGHPHCVILTGEAGIGKTRLAEEMEAWVSRQGMTTASAHCYASLRHLAYAPISSWLRSDALQASLSSLDKTLLPEIARLVPEVLDRRPELPRPTSMTEGWQRRQFFEALARALLSARQPLLLLLDDLQWCDDETLEWLHYLLRFAPRARLLLIGTVRAGEALPGHPIVEFLATLQRDGLANEIALDPLTTSETTALAEHIMGHPLDGSTGTALYAETEGNPLFVVEMARADEPGQHGNRPAAIRGRSSLLTQSASLLPPSVQSVLATRLAQLSPLAHEVANVAAVIGREFSFTVLTAASGAGEDSVVQGLDELWQRRIIREQGAGNAETYDFSHDKLREYVYASLSPASRRLLHRHVAEALEAVYGGEQDAASGQIAAHYERASLPDRAIPYYYRAGEAAQRVYANKEAVKAFERAAALLDSHAATRQGSSRKMAAQVYEALGDALIEIGRHQEARRCYERVEDSFSEEMRLDRARLLRKLANTWNHASNNPHDSFHATARQAFQEAERILQDAWDITNAQWRTEWIELQFSYIWPLRGTEEDLTTAIEKCRPVIEQYGTGEQRERLSFALLMRDLTHMRYVVSEERISSLRARLTSLQETNDLGRKSIGYLAFGGVLLWSGHLDEAQEQLEKGLRLGEQTGSAWLQTRCLTFLSFIFRSRGQVDQLRAILARAEVAGADRDNTVLIGHRAWLAWRAGDLAEAERYGLQSIAERSLMEQVNPFLWTGLWPLIGVALSQDRLTDAINFARMLLDPTRQPPPEPLKALLTSALQAWDTGQEQEVRSLLQQSVPPAQEMGYL
jgi:DNA-binding SARP family transcriptional activator